MDKFIEWATMESSMYILIISVVASILATVFVLITRLVFYRIRDTLPAGALFDGIAHSLAPCLVYIIRMKDMEKKEIFITPEPDYSSIRSTTRGEYPQYEPRILTPWVTSTAEAQALSLILNVLGRIRRTENIELTYADRDYDVWDAPMFILGGSWKAIRALEMCNPIFQAKDMPDKPFKLVATGQEFAPFSHEEDLGLLQKMINPTNDHPVWVVMGWRGNGTVAAAYALVRWWKYLGKLYGRRPFGLLVSMDDKAGWQQSSIRSIHPEPKWYRKLSHFIAWFSLKRKMESKEQTEDITSFSSSIATNSTSSLSMRVEPMEDDDSNPTE